jgi:hypothetical protein
MACTVASSTIVVVIVAATRQHRILLTRPSPASTVLCQRSLFGLVGTTVAGRRTALLYQRGAKYQCQPTGCVDSLFRQHRCRPRAKRHPTVTTTAANIAVSCHHRIRTVFGGGPLVTKTGQ